ncbi:hypothetical protein OIU84_014386 [Salix udensis]|uniref:Uncharacterized protein n=1 Tax=Salix udensis TaxID=889485 RepID=A0AAD6JDW6_9ROSI|nr:hypothetical protein OIU84_014386 [Salix udensis]
MESTTLLVLSYLFKVFVFTKPSLAADEVAVLDTVGEELKADTEYYILPVLRGGGGGLTMISIGFQLKHLLPPTITAAATDKNGCAQPRFQTELDARLFLPGLNF